MQYEYLNPIIDGVEPEKDTSPRFDKALDSILVRLTARIIKNAKGSDVEDLVLSLKSICPETLFEHVVREGRKDKHKLIPSDLFGSKHLTKKGNRFIAAVAEYIASELIELAGN